MSCLAFQCHVFHFIVMPWHALHFLSFPCHALVLSL
jgi:hypothetical protein